MTTRPVSLGWAWLAFAAAFIGCGARTGLSLPDSTASCDWVASPDPPVALTGPRSADDSDVYYCEQVSDVLVEGARLFVAMTDCDPHSTNGQPLSAWLVRVVSDDLSQIGPVNTVLTRAAIVDFTDINLASGFGRRAAIASDADTGCHFVALSDDGSAVGAPVSIGGACGYFYRSHTGGGLFATASGFSGLSSGGASTLTLDPSGKLLARHALFPMPRPHGGAEALGRVRLDDGSEIIGSVTYDDAFGPYALQTSHVSETGDALSEPFQLPGADFPDVAMAALGSQALTAWIASSDFILPAATSSSLRTALVGDAGATTVARTFDALPRLVGIAATDHGPLLARTSWAPGAARLSVIVEPIAMTGAALGNRITVPFPSDPLNLRLVATPFGAALIVDTSLGVFATTLHCRP